jgi:hypothetical protein
MFLEDNSFNLKDPAKGTALEIGNGDLFDKSSPYAKYFQNMIFYQFVIGAFQKETMNRIDLIKGTKNEVKDSGKPLAVSPDKMHMLLHSNGLKIWNIAKEEAEAIIPFEGGGSEDSLAIFISNRFFLTPSGRLNTLDIWRIDGTLVDTVEFDIGENLWLSDIWFSDDFSRAFVNVMESTELRKIGIGFMDSLAFQKYIIDRYLFRKMKGILIKNEVDIRENPNMDANIVGRAEKNDFADVIDVSSLKERIGPSEFYWYKIMTMEGEQGWVYGSYLDLTGASKM